MVFNERVSIDSTMVESVISLEKLVNTKDVHIFLRQVGYYRCFIQDFSHVPAPLTNLIKKEFYFDWDPECEESILEIRCRLATTLVLVFPNNVEYL